MAKKKDIVITLKKSLIGRKPKHVATAHALGLRSIGQSKSYTDNPALRGMIKHIEYMLHVEGVA